jgi:hypothetical protein
MPIHKIITAFTRHFCNVRDSLQLLQAYDRCGWLGAEEKERLGAALKQTATGCDAILKIVKSEGQDLGLSSPGRKPMQ